MLLSASVLSLVSAGPSDAEVRLPLVLGDQSSTTEAAAQGNWQVELEPVAARDEPTRLIVQGLNRLTLEDVVARAGLQAYRHLNRSDMAEVPADILRRLDSRHLLAYLDPDRYAPAYRHRTKLLSGDGATNWLWAYWLGREQGVFAPT